MHAATPSLTISSCHFEGNNAAKAVTLHIGIFTVASLMHSWFVNNIGVDVALARSENTNATLTIDTCIFDAGFVKKSQALDLPDVSRLTVAHSVVRGYTDIYASPFTPVYIYGGHGLDKRCTLENVTIYNNTAGGVQVATNNILVQINGCYFDSNRRPYDPHSDRTQLEIGYGEGELNPSPGITLWLTNSTFENNYGADGGMYLTYLDCIAVVNVTFRNNTGTNAGAVTIEGTGAQGPPHKCASAAAYVDDMLSANAFDNRQFSRDGNVSDAAQWAFSPLSDSRKSTASITSFVLEPSTSNIDFRDCIFIDNIGFGGALEMIDTRYTTSVLRCTFHNNSGWGGGYGGAVHMTGTAGLNIWKSNFTSNSASHGGALYMETFGTKLLLEDTLFENNIAQVAGGAIAVHTVWDLTVHRGISNWNYANASGGGAMMCQDCSRISACDTFMRGNRAGGDGGAVQALGSALKKMIFDGVHMSNNT